MGKLAKLATFLQTYGPWGIFGLALLDSMGIPLPAVDFLLIGIGVDAVHRPGVVYFAAATRGVHVQEIKRPTGRRRGGLGAERYHVFGEPR